MAHSLVPPTPGPLLVAEELGIDIGLMILAGCCVGLCSSTVAYFYARWVNRRAELPLRESADFSLEELEALAKRDESTLPPLSLAVLPIVLPSGGGGRRGSGGSTGRGRSRSHASVRHDLRRGGAAAFARRSRSIRSRRRRPRLRRLVGRFPGW